MSFSGNQARWPTKHDEPRKKTFLSSATRLLLLQIVEQMHLNRARYCILGTWDYYVVFHLKDRYKITCSDIVSRDSKFDDNMFNSSVIM